MACRAWLGTAAAKQQRGKQARHVVESVGTDSHHALVPGDEAWHVRLTKGGSSSAHLVDYYRCRHVCCTQALLFKVRSKLGHGSLPRAALGPCLHLRRHCCPSDLRAAAAVAVAAAAINVATWRIASPGARIHPRQRIGGPQPWPAAFEIKLASCSLTPVHLDCGKTTAALNSASKPALSDCKPHLQSPPPPPALVVQSSRLLHCAS